MEQNGVDAIKVIKEIKDIYLVNNIKTKILAASFRNTEQVVRVIKAGADAVTISSNLFRDMFDNYLTTKSIIKFNEDWKKLITIIK